jgi:hypothetical protein
LLVEVVAVLARRQLVQQESWAAAETLQMLLEAIRLVFPAFRGCPIMAAAAVELADVLVE